MKAELQWPLYFCGHKRFCKCPLKDEVQVSLALTIITLAPILVLILAI